MTSLLIIRTPLQALIGLKVLEAESINTFDLVYFTQHDSLEDKYYYNLLSSKASNSGYYFIKSIRPSILSYVLFKIKTRKWYKRYNYENVLLASINAPFITALARNYPDARLITFDDGAANILPNSMYYKKNNKNRSKLYNLLLKSLSIEEVKSRIFRHYTIYKHHDNIVEASKVRFIDTIITEPSFNTEKEFATKTYFIGAPFHLVLTNAQITRLEKHLRELKIDSYVQHPQELHSLNISVPKLNKAGRVAEEAILMNARGSSIILIGWLSSVMLNLNDRCSEKIVLLPIEMSGDKNMLELSKKFNCKVVYF